MEPRTKERAIGVSVAAVGVLVAAFLPWGQLTTTMSVNLPGMNGNAPINIPFGGMKVTADVNGWNGSLRLAGMTVPNWFTVVLAFAATAVVWLAATGVWNPPRYLAVVLAALGLFQTAATLFVLVGSGQSSMGIGIIVAIAAFIGMLRLAIRLAVATDDLDETPDATHP